MDPIFCIDETYSGAEIEVGLFDELLHTSMRDKDNSRVMRNLQKSHRSLFVA
jgi:hypothetical protein